MNRIVPIIEQKIKDILEWGRWYEKELYVGAVVVLSSALAYGSGLLVLELRAKEPVVIRDLAGALVEASPVRSPSPAGEKVSEVVSTGKGTPLSAASAKTAGLVVGTRSTKKYRLPGCAGIDTVAEKNRVYFKTAADAEKAGYVRVKNCSIKP
ncbi:MAG: hypothetical protein V4674_00080 [Patescibacteria group bacterium]